MKDNTAVTNHVDFDIKSNGPVSKEFIDRHIWTFQQASLYVRHLPYKRNTDKNNLVTVFTDHGGTCSTKHALLKELAVENKFGELKLMVGLFKMNKNNTPAITTTLLKNNLEYIPEAHCYLKFGEIILDMTKANTKPSDFMDDLIEEIEILPEQITDYKVNYHKTYLTAWLLNNKQLNYTLDELWRIREQCIQDLANS